MCTCTEVQRKLNFPAVGLISYKDKHQLTIDHIEVGCGRRVAQTISGYTGVPSGIFLSDVGEQNHLRVFCACDVAALLRHGH